MSNNTTPYGYRLENGKAVIQEEEADRLREMSRLYLSGLSFVEAANRVGLKMYHGTVRNLLKNKKYLGTDFYPAILDQETFEAIETERKRRVSTTRAVTAFTVPKVELRYTNPEQQAEYAYSLIEREVK